MMKHAHRQNVIAGSFGQMMNSKIRLSNIRRRETQIHTKSNRERERERERETD